MSFPMELKRRGFKVKLLKVGSPGFGISREDTLNQIRRLGILDDVIFTGFVPESMLPLYYNTADLFVFPSRIEGFGLPPLEAMACGCPVISSNTSSLPEVVGDGGILIDPDDNITLTNVMVQILTDEKYRKDLIKRGLYRASCYSWDLMAEKTIGVFKDLECRL
jgi:glycosyltransferase involved in cell wall biosynthesis